MQVVITGSQGTLGSELCRQFGDAAIGLDLPAFDLTDRGGVRTQLFRIRPDVVINTAAYTAVDQAETDAETCRAVNVAGVRILADACREIDAVLVQLSTDYVFGGDDRVTPYTESDLPSPRGVYAVAKYEGEQFAREWKKHFVVRTGGLYGLAGPRSTGNFVDTILRLARKTGRLRVVADQQCSPTYAVHLARAIRCLASTAEFGTYHVTNQGQTTWHRFAEEVLRLHRLDLPVDAIASEAYEAPAPRPRYSILDTRKYHALKGVVVMPHWQSAIAEYAQIGEDPGLSFRVHGGHLAKSRQPSFLQGRTKPAHT